MKQKLLPILLVYCIASYVGFIVFFALTPLWMSFRTLWGQMGIALPIYGLLAPISMPALTIAPFTPPGPGIHACIFWFVYAVVLIACFLLLPQRLFPKSPLAH